jgi:hypothetical protein
MGSWTGNWRIELWKISISYESCGACRVCTAFNAGMKMAFSDNTAWMVRFPRVGTVCDDYTDEKVAMEVTALSLIRNRTTIPVPRVQAWGPAASNLLGLGPFIMMDFINGVSLSDLLEDPNAERPTRLMREDISDSDIEVIYRQLANFLLQLFKLDFDRIGSSKSFLTSSSGREAHSCRSFHVWRIIDMLIKVDIALSDSSTYTVTSLASWYMDRISGI